MPSDSFFTIGSTHKVCQDYAMSMEDADKEIVVLSDGCSSAKDSDLGARLLPRILLSGGAPVECIKHLYDMRISLESLFCTLLCIKRGHEETEILLSGDGYCAIEYDWGVDLINFGSPYNAPFYFVYQYLELDKQKYFDLFGHENFYKVTKLIKGDCGYEEVSTAELEFSVDERPMQNMTIANDYKSISIFSDGLASFVRGNDNMKVAEVLGHFLDIKIPNGEFVYRTCRRAIKDLKMLGYSNFDDFSMGTIHA